MPNQSNGFRRLHFDFFKLRNEISEYAQKYRKSSSTVIRATFSKCRAVQFLPQLAGLQMGSLARVRNVARQKTAGISPKHHSGARHASALKPTELLTTY
jgi:hypothetical protein